MDQQLDSVDVGDTDIDSLGVFNNLARGARLGNAIGLDEAHLEAVYTLASGQYQQRRYTEAMKLFFFITFHDQTFIKAFKGIGCCLQMLGHYQEALVYLGLAIIDDDKDLQTAVQIAECLIQTKQRANAKKLLERISIECEQGNVNYYTRCKVDGLLYLLSEE